MALFSRKRRRGVDPGIERERTFLRRRGGQDADGGRPADRFSGLIRWGTGLGLLVIITLMFPPHRAYRYNLNENDIAQETIVAPFTFQIRRSTEELEQMREEARQSIPLVLVFNEDVEVRQTVRLDTLFQMLTTLPEESENDSTVIATFQQYAPEVDDESLLYIFAGEVRGRSDERRMALSTQRIDSLKSAAERVVAHYFSIGVVDSKDPLHEMAGSTEWVKVILGEEERDQRLSVVIDMDEALDSMANMLRENLPGADERLVKAGFEIASAVLRPNLILDRERTERRRADAASNIALIKGTVMADEKIVDANTRVTPDVIEKLNSLNIALAEREAEEGNWWVGVRTWLARLLLVALILGIYVAYLQAWRSPLLEDNRTLISIAVVIALELGLAYLLHNTDVFSTYLVPVAVATMLVTVLFDAGVGIITAFVLGLLIGSVLGLEYQIALVHTAAGAAGVFAVRRVKKRSHFYRALWAVPLVYLIGIVGVELLRFSEFSELVSSTLYGVANGMLSVVVAMGLLPIFESLFNFTTDISLLELSDLNHPLLRQLAMRAPGTYQHSLMMGELGAAAAEACGANPLLTRVGAYFHDIGKMNKPEYFVENQQGKNPHAKLSPSMSALIVETHVKEGLELAEEHRLPEKIKAFIPEHHGTQPMTFFYLKAVEEARNGEKVLEDDFRYAGPKPKSRETGIIMLADAVEAASRALDEPNPRRLTTMVKELIERRFKDGELDDCPLTLRDLRLVQEAFVNVLTSRFHQRIDYPDKEETLKKAAEREAEAKRKAREEVSEVVEE